jgi:exopolyphosphatase/guanosine-5'-triphosphate,3'-diphosphate pyrophosphatase
MILMHTDSHPVKISISLMSLIVCALYLTACVHNPNPVEIKCIEYRAAFDIGSGTTKMKVGRIDKCNQKNIEIVYKKEVKVPYAENISGNLFDVQVQRAGLAALQELKAEAKTKGAQTFAGVATAAFRLAVNTPEFLQEIKIQTGIPVRLLSQDEEAILGYMAALSVLGLKTKDAVVWDIGGYSMQMIFSCNDRDYVIYNGRLASISFKEKILSEIKHQPPGQHKSPNPIGKDNLEKALKIAMLAAAEVPEEIREKLSKPNAIIIGIGGVHNQSVAKQLRIKNIYRREELISELNTCIDLTDKEIGGQYTDTEISNLILVLGFMQQLGLSEVMPLNINLADGVLINPAFW